MAYTKLKKQPPVRDEKLDYEQLGPGLYHDETAFELDDGTLVAVSVERYWPENGSGVALHGYARWINEDGSTQLAPNGAHVEAAKTIHFDPLSVEEFGVDELATDLARLMIGEEPQLTPVQNVSLEAKLNANIRNQVKAVNATRSHHIGL